MARPQPNERAPRPNAASTRAAHLVDSVEALHNDPAPVAGVVTTHSAHVMADIASVNVINGEPVSIALVTGANRGLGYAVARGLAKTGGCVILTGRDLAKSERAAAELRAEGLDVRALALDVTSPESVAAASKTVQREYGCLDILVNNAGVLPEAVDSEPHEFSGKSVFEATFATNVFGVVTVVEAFLPLLRRSAMGRIVNVSTTMGSLTDQASPDSPWYQLGVPAYRSSKAALNSITVSLAKALAGSDIKVTSVCPGWVQTDLAPGNREQAPLTADQAAQVVLTAATLPAAADSGTFIAEGALVPW